LRALWGVHPIYPLSHNRMAGPGGAEAAMAQAQRMNAAQPKETTTNEQRRRRSIMCVQPCAWCRRRKWALLIHATSVQSSRLSWHQNNRGNRAGAMGCFPHVHTGGHCQHPDVFCARQMRSNGRSKAALHHGPILSANPSAVAAVVKRRRSPTADGSANSHWRLPGSLSQDAPIAETGPAS